MYNYTQSVEQYKPFIRYLIQFYYKDLHIGTGGNLHIVLDDGNTDCIQSCKEWCEEHEDSFGFFLCRVLEEFTEDELDEMYDSDWWGMSPEKGQLNMDQFLCKGMKLEPGGLIERASGINTENKE